MITDQNYVKNDRCLRYDLVILFVLTDMVFFVGIHGIKSAVAGQNQPSSNVVSTLSALEGIDIEFNIAQAKGKMLLLCFWDYQQRPSRNMVRELASQEKELQNKGLVVLLVQTAEVQVDTISGWVKENSIPFTSGRIPKDLEKVLFRWGVRSQPWLVLADENGKIKTGGFELNQLDAVLLGKSLDGSTEKQSSQNPDEIVLKLVDSNGLPVSGAKAGNNVVTRDSLLLNSYLQWSLRGNENNISNDWGEIKLSKEQLFPSFWSEGRKVGIFVLHEERKIGATCDISKDDTRGVIELKLMPVCHVYGKLGSEGLKQVGRPLSWTNVYFGWSRDSFGIFSHTSDQQRFEFFVPPGKYELYAYGSGGDGSDPSRTSASTEHKTQIVEVKENQRQLDLGSIDLPPTKIATFIGKQAPEIGPIQAWKNGSPVKLSDLKGKAVILNFDGNSPNTSRDLPRFVELHDQYKDHGLVIIAIFNSSSMEELEKKWAEVYKQYGGEPEVPFRVAVDGGKSSYYGKDSNNIRLGQTYATYDIIKFPTTILINPEGNIVGELNLFYAKETIQKMLGVMNAPDIAQWRQRFNKVYFLEEGKILKRIAPPFIQERADYYKEEESTQYSLINRPPDFFTFHWDGALKKWGMGFGDPRTLNSVLNNSLSMSQNTYEGSKELLAIEVPGDWIVRKDATEEQKLKALEEILSKEIGRNIRFEKRSVEQEAIVATGSFKYNRLPVAKNDQSVIMFTGDNVDETGGSGYADSVKEFLEAIGNIANYPILDQTTTTEKIVIPYDYYRSAYLRNIENPSEKSEKLLQLLDNISRQTNLQFKVEKRAIEKWFVVENTKQ
jgi:hypothetical protein